MFPINLRNAILSSVLVLQSLPVSERTPALFQTSDRINFPCPFLLRRRLAKPGLLPEIPRQERPGDLRV